MLREQRGILTSGNFPRASNFGLQRLKLLVRCIRRGTFDPSVPSNERRAEGCEYCPAAVFASGLPLNRSMPADAIDLINQVPCALVGHIHRAPRRRNRTTCLDLFEQLNLAGPDSAFRIKIN